MFDVVFRFYVNIKFLVVGGSCLVDFGYGKETEFIASCLFLFSRRGVGCGSGIEVSFVL